MIVSQIFLAAGIALFATQGNAPRVSVVVALALVVAFWSATQDIAIDSTRSILERSNRGSPSARARRYRAAVLVRARSSLTDSATAGRAWQGPRHALHFP
jgi:hypothetical protein